MSIDFDSIRAVSVLKAHFQMEGFEEEMLEEKVMKLVHENLF